MGVLRSAVLAYTTQPGPGQNFLPRLYDLSQKHGLPFCGYFYVGADLITSNLRSPWEIPTSRSYTDTESGFLAPESPWTDLLCERTVLERQLHRLLATVRAVSPQTQIGFCVPYWEPAEALWVNRPMLLESDFLVAESTRSELIDWLVSIRKPRQHIMTTIIGLTEKGETNPHLCRELIEKGSDYFFGYGWGTPPDFRPHPHYGEDLEIVRQAFKEMG